MIIGKGEHIVYIDGEILLPTDSLKLANHSPSGFAWGYAGSGPSQLALALLLHFTDKEFALANYMNFKFDVVANLGRGDFGIANSAVTEWAKKKGWKGKV